MNSRKLMYIAIVVMCVIAVVLAIYLQSGKQLAIVTQQTT